MVLLEMMLAAKILVFPSQRSVFDMFTEDRSESVWGVVGGGDISKVEERSG